MTLQKHPIWEVFPAAETFESFQKNFASPIFLKNEVPDFIKKSSLVVEKLLLHSYYEYEFIDIALTHAVFDFEKAMRLRWIDIHGKETKQPLYALIDWFYKERYFETLNDGLPHQLRHIRNGKAHDPIETLGGVVFIKKIYDTYLLINDIYEDVQLRILRTDTRYQLNDSLSKLTTNGAILHCNGQRLILFLAFPIFIDNKSLRKTIKVFICPIFDLSPYAQNEVYAPCYSALTLKNWSFKNDVFEGIDIETDNPIYIEPIQDNVNANRFATWSESFWRYENAALNLFSASRPADELFIEELRKFHKI